MSAIIAMTSMDRTPPLAQRPLYLGIHEIADRWSDWGYRPDQHHCVLIAFFESWGAIKSRVGADEYHCLAKTLSEHYRQAEFPADAKTAPYVYWLAGEHRTPKHSYVASREEFDQRYLAQFGPLFDVVEWLSAYRKDPAKAVDDINARAAKALAANKADEENPPQPGKRTDLLYKQKNDIKEVKNKKVGTSVEYAHRKLRDDRPDIHARVLAGELSAHAGMIEAGFRKKAPSRKQTPFQIISKLLPKLTDGERDALRRLLNERRAA